MTKKDRLERTFSKESVDRKPCICPGGMMNMITVDLMDEALVYWPMAHTDSKMMADLALASYEKGCFENLGVPFCMTVEAESFGSEVSIGNKYTEPHVTGYAIETVSDFYRLNKIDLETGRVKVVLDAIKILKEKNLDVPIIGNITGPISTATSLLDSVVFYKELRKKREDAHKFLSFITENLKEFSIEQIKAGADIITISDPSGTGEILGPVMFEEFAFKYLKILVDEIHKEKKRVIVHICGQMRSVYKHIEKLGADALSFDAIVPMNEARKNLPNSVLMGNISTYALEFSDKEKVSSLTRSCIDNSSDIISPACGLGTKSPIENIKTILETLKEETEKYA